MFFTGFGIGLKEVRLDVVSFDLFQNLVCAVLSLILKIQNGIYEVLVFEGAETVLETQARKNSVVVERGLTIQVELSRAPSSSAVLQLSPVGMEIVSTQQRLKSLEGVDHQIPC